ncbi:hypothetical protein Mal4_43130 [Maioricimonas rarisocia]|uniref:N-acetyltransferase domain-containing protein n=1 Tax=Maioricimonas rarisocia TaxID=2528026 RepID=A0A517ZBY7_9PLAN|nr:GNAT family protein [Maioricimonas rarisocia]QDU39959.1 hypothetical protein Mal4_43130 [Maioricimonas rarisocia]
MIRLVPITTSLGQSLQEGHSTFDETYGLQCGDLGELIGQVVAATLEMHAPQGPAEPWCGYLAADGQTGAIVGTCAFKSPPTAEGVEIAYFTFPPFEGKGYGTAMAAQLTELASGAGPGVRVFAQTLPESSVSTRILERNGFRRVGERQHPEDGRVWEWERLP